MLRRKKTKILALALSLIMLALVFAPVDPKTVGLCFHASCAPYWSYGNLTYSFFHVNVFHWLLNVWCFLSCVFLADVSFRKVLLSYLIACSVPAMSTIPTIGVSGVCFALLGMIMWRSTQKRSYNIIIGATVACMFALCPKTVNNVLHIYCYLLGVASVPAYNGLRSLTRSHNS